MRDVLHYKQHAQISETVDGKIFSTELLASNRDNYRHQVAYDPSEKEFYGAHVSGIEQRNNTNCSSCAVLLGTLL